MSDEDDLTAALPPDTQPLAAATPERRVSRGTLVGRYVVINEIGGGGMGRVFLAFDPELARRVAIKLVRDRSSQGQARLLREAQTMAQLSHANTVAVYDVGTYEDQVFLAMEFVDGSTAREWLDAKPRSWREVVRKYALAGRGLAAAHHVDIAHRDFKPDNIIIGNDGKVCVTDFGLAFGAASAHVTDEMAHGPHVLGVHVTRRGAIVGTPGYVAPELLNGGPADHRSDQFGFCVSLHEALYGERPAPGADTRHPPARRGAHAVPAWLWPILERGLSEAPADRFPSMDALLAQLEIDRTSRRRRWVATVAAATTLFVTGGLVVAARGGGDGHREARACQAARSELAGVWDAAVRDRIERAFAATGVPYQAETLASAFRDLDTYASDWMAMRTEACEATEVRHDQDEEMLALRMTCLDQRRRELAALTDAAEQPDARVVEKLAQATTALSRVAACADREALRLAMPAPVSPAQATELDRLRDEIGVARVTWTLGRFAEARPLCDAAVVRARALHARALESEALLLQGSVEMGLGDGDAAARALMDALWAAEASRRDDLAADAALRLALTIGYLQARPADAEPWLALAAAIEERLGAPPTLVIERLSARGILATRRGENETAVESFRLATELAVQTYGETHLSTAKRYGDLGGALVEYGDPQQAIVQIERALAIRRDLQGSTHPDVAMHLSNLATACSRAGDTSRAVALLTEAVEMRERLLGPDNPLLVISLNNLASVLLDDDRAEEAFASALRAVAIAEAGLGEDHVHTITAEITLGGALTRLARASEAEATLEGALAKATRLGEDHWAVAGTLETLLELRRRQSRHRDVVDLAQRAIGIRERTQRADAPDLAVPLAALGRAELTLGHPHQAVDALERAVSIQAATGAPIALAETRFALATAIWATGTGRERSRELATLARDALATPKTQARADEITGWINDHAGAR